MFVADRGGFFSLIYISLKIVISTLGLSYLSYTKREYTPLLHFFRFHSFSLAVSGSVCQSEGRKTFRESIRGMSIVDKETSRKVARWEMGRSSAVFKG